MYLCKKNKEYNPNLFFIINCVKNIERFKHCATIKFLFTSFFLAHTNTPLNNIVNILLLIRAENSQFNSIKNFPRNFLAVKECLNL